MILQVRGFRKDAGPDIPTACELAPGDVCGLFDERGQFADVALSDTGEVLTIDFMRIEERRR